MRLFPGLVDEVQAGFVKDWSIATHIVLAQEILRNLNRKVKGVNVVIKLDMAKAYDKLEWRFLLKVLESFGFNAGAIRTYAIFGTLSGSTTNSRVVFDRSEGCGWEIPFLPYFLSWLSKCSR